MQKNALIIFKSKPAKIVGILDKKIDIETVDGKKIKLPPKNVELLFQNDKDFDLLTSIDNSFIEKVNLKFCKLILGLSKKAVTLHQGQSWDNIQ